MVLFPRFGTVLVVIFEGIPGFEVALGSQNKTPTSGVPGSERCPGNFFGVPEATPTGISPPKHGTLTCIWL